jgi:hypothetical protein
MTIRYIIAATGSDERVEEFAVVESYSLAKSTAEQFAKFAPHDALVTIYEGKQLAVYSGRVGLEDSITQDELSYRLRGHGE